MEGAAGTAVQVRDLRDLPEIRALADLFARIWGRAGDAPVTSDLLRALAHSGNCVAGAFAGSEMIGGLAGFLGRDDRHGLHLHSHILGVLPDHRSGGAGYALKQHQRRWAQARGIAQVVWTFDPLVAANARFNLQRLGADVDEYLVDFYGPMADALNRGGASDRALAVWRVGSPRAQAAASGSLPEPDLEELRGEGAAFTLEASADGEPVVTRAGADVLLCQVPADIVALRAADPGLAGRWRLALRAALGGAMREGRRVTGMSRSGCYVLERRR